MINATWITYSSVKLCVVHVIGRDRDACPAQLAANMERVLGTPELLQRIFSLLDLASNAANARVCQRWFDLALEILWRNVDNPYFLFKILAPLKKSSGSGKHYVCISYTRRRPCTCSYQPQEFQRLPSSSDWKRFWKYGTQVRCLSFRKNSPHLLLGSVLETISTTRTTLDIFPNLHTLVLDAEGPNFYNLCVILMHTHIKSFTLTLSTHLTRSPQFLFEEIRARMPDLTDINIRSYIPMRTIEAELISLISPLLRLKTIILPRFYLTTKFTEALSRLPDLMNIQIGQEAGHGDRIDVTPFAPDLTGDSFPNLLGHSMMATFHDATHFLEKNFSPTNLERLYIESDINEAASSIHSLVSAISVISQNCLNLKIICLVSYAGIDSLPDVTQIEDLTIDVLKPLFKLSGLVDVQLLHRHPLALKQQDIEFLASSWPLLTTLKLNHHPIHYTTPSSLTLEALVPFAKCCPNLKCLCLFVDANDKLFLPVDLIPFQNLEMLDLGFSSISGTERVAVYLSGILPLQCKLCPALPSDILDRIDSIQEVRRSQQLMKQWAKVADLLGILQIARLHERTRNQYLLLLQSMAVLPARITLNEM